jgi:hypothetical protein
MEESFVRIMKCRFCGKETNAIALHKRLRPIKEDVFDEEPCEECKKRFATHKYFVGDCGHAGFVKIDALGRLLNPESLTSLIGHNVFRMEKCFACLSCTAICEFPTV